MRFRWYHFSFFSIIIFNLILRYPSFAYENGTDSFGNHVLANFIVNNGYDSRYIHFLSYFGLVTFSNNMGAVFFLAGFSIITDLGVHSSIFILSIMLAVFGCFSVFIMSFEINRDIKTGLVACLLFSTSRTYLYYTEWTYSFRGSLMFFIPLLFFIIFKFVKLKKMDRRFLFLLMCLSFSAFAIHHASMIFFIFLMAYIFQLLLVRASNRFNQRIISFTQFQKVSFVFPIMFAFYIYSLIFGSFYEGARDTTKVLGEEMFFKDSSPFFFLINLGLLYSMSLGFTSILVIKGIFDAVDNIKTISNPSVLIMLIIFFYSILWVDVFYSLMIILPIFCFLIGLSISVFYKKKNLINKKIIFPVFFSVLIVMQFIPEIISVSETGSAPSNDSEYSRNKEIVLAYSTGLYLRSNEMDYGIYAEGVSAPKIMAYSGYHSNFPYSPPLKYDTSGFHVNEFSDLISGRTDRLLSTNPDFKGYSMRYDVTLSVHDYTHPVVEASFLSNYHDKEVIVALYSKNTTHVKDDTGNLRASTFLESVVSDSYNIYRNEYHLLYFLDMGDAEK